MKIKIALIVAGLLLASFLFYWFQWRPSEVRKNCFREVYSKTINLEWAEGKEWMYYKDGKWGWLLPYWQIRDSESLTYRGCLLYNGLK